MVAMARKSLTIVILATRVSIIVVEPIDLSISFCYQSSSEVINFTIRSKRIDSTTTICLLSGWKRN